MMKKKELETIDTELNAMIERGEILQAFERFYDDDVVMTENSNSPTRGKAANRKREQRFIEDIEELHTARVRQQGIGDDVTFAELQLDATLKNGERMQISEVCRREWKDGKVVDERFYYQPSPT